MNAEPKKAAEQPRPSLRRALKDAPQRFWRLIYHNWPWKLLALFLALCLWAGLITQDPTLTRERVFGDVTISVTGADTLRRNSGLIVLSGLEDENLTARMRVDVPQREYNTVTASNYNPRVDLTRITEAGEQTLRIITTSTSTYGTVRSISPETVTVVVDQYVTNYRVPVSVNIIGEYPEGFYGTPISLDPSAVTLSGPKSLVDEIVRVYVDFDVSRLAAKAGTVRTALPMRFVNADGDEIESDLLEVTSADVVLRTITVEQDLYPTRTVSLSSVGLTEGEPAEGYRVASVSVTPATVLIAASQTTLDLLDELAISDPVDITGRTETFSVEVEPQWPSDAVYLSAEAVTLTVEIEPVMVSRTFESVKLFSRGAASDVSVSLNTKTLGIVVRGPQLIMDGLRAASVVAYVDVAGLEPGTYELPVELHVEDTDMTGMTFTATPSTVLATVQ